MGFGSEVENVGDVVLLDDADDLGLIAEVDFLETVAGIGFKTADVGGMTRVGEAVEIDERLDPGLVDQLAEQVGADEAATAGDEKIHGLERRQSWLSSVERSGGRSQAGIQSDRL